MVMLLARGSGGGGEPHRRRCRGVRQVFPAQAVPASRRCPVHGSAARPDPAVGEESSTEARESRTRWADTDQVSTAEKTSFTRPLQRFSSPALTWARSSSMGRADQHKVERVEGARRSSVQGRHQQGILAYRDRVLPHQTRRAAAGPYRPYVDGVSLVANYKTSSAASSSAAPSPTFPKELLQKAGY